jgi:hypothetical protein
MCYIILGDVFTNSSGHHYFHCLKLQLTFYFMPSTSISVWPAGFWKNHLKCTFIAQFIFVKINKKCLSMVKVTQNSRIFIGYSKKLSKVTNRRKFVESVPNLTKHDFTHFTHICKKTLQICVKVLTNLWKWILPNFCKYLWA